MEEEDDGGREKGMKLHQRVCISSYFPVTSFEKYLRWKKRRREGGDGGENKAGYAARQPRTVGQGQWRKNRSQFRMVTDLPTDQLGKV